MVRIATIACGECGYEFDFDFDGEEFRDYGGTQCPECEHEIEDLDPADFFFTVAEDHEGEDISFTDLTRHRCNACDEVFGIRPEFGGEVNCPYCGGKYA